MIMDYCNSNKWPLIVLHGLIVYKVHIITIMKSKSDLQRAKKSKLCIDKRLEAYKMYFKRAQDSDQNA